MEEEEEEKQYRTCLYVAESETKASLKQVTEEIVRFSLSTCGGQPIILMADGERATKQILRAVQHCRAAIGLSTEIRAQARHASNGQAERTVQTVSEEDGKLSEGLC